MTHTFCGLGSHGCTRGVCFEYIAIENLRDIGLADAEAIKLSFRERKHKIFTSKTNQVVLEFLYTKLLFNRHVLRLVLYVTFLVVMSIGGVFENSRNNVGTTWYLRQALSQGWRPCISVCGCEFTQSDPPTSIFFLSSTASHRVLSFFLCILPYLHRFIYLVCLLSLALSLALSRSLAALS
jgi:hypothetical protein